MTTSEFVKDFKTEKKILEIECYFYLYGNKSSFHTDKIEWTDEDVSNNEVLAWELMDEEEYNRTINANSCFESDFASLYGDMDKDAVILCILVKPKNINE